MARRSTAFVFALGMALAAGPHAPSAREAAPRPSGPDARPQAGCDARPPDSLAFIPVPGHPFQALPSRDGCWLFVSLDSNAPATPSGIGVLRRAGEGASLTRVVPLGLEPAGMVLTHDGRLLVATDADSVFFLDTTRLVSGIGDPIVGRLSDGAGAGSVYANVTSDDRTLFVSDERRAQITVIDLAKARASGFQGDAIVGRVPVGRAPIALTLSPDERLLYTTSQAAAPEWMWPAQCTPEGDPNARSITNAAGAIVVVDVAKARMDPGNAIVARVPAGCNPVRLALSLRGDVAYVTARHSNAVLAFDTAKLLSDAAHACTRSIPVGTAPVGVAVVNPGRELVVIANSNRFAGGADDVQRLSVIDPSRADSSGGAVVGSILAGGFPRELRLTDGGRTLVVTNFASSAVELVDLPWACERALRVTQR